MSIRRKLGRRLADLRKEGGLTQEALAEKAGYSVEFISLMERGIHAPSVDGLERLAGALKVDIRDFFDFTVNENA